MFVRRIAALLILSGAGACASTQTATSLEDARRSAATAKNDATPIHARAENVAVATRFHTGMIAVRDAATTNPPTDAALLKDVTDFYEVAVGWVVLDDATYRSMTSRDRALAWVAVIPIGHPQLDSMDSIMDEGNASIHVTRVKPDTISARWGAAMLTYELSLMRDDVEMQNDARLGEKATMQWPARQMRAYRTEVAAIHALGGRPFTQRIRALVDSANAESAIVMRHSAVKIARENLRDLMAMVDPGKPLTEREESRRMGVLMMSLLLEYGRRHQISDAVLHAALGDGN